MDSLSDPKHYMPDEARLAAIRERIAEYNHDRPAILQKAYVQVAVFMGCYAAVILLLGYGVLRAGDVNKFAGFLFGLAIVAGWYVWEFAWEPVKEHQLDLRYRLFPEIFGFIDKVQYSHGHAPGFLAQIRQMKLVQHNGSENDDLVSGTHDGLKFEMVESKLTVGSGKDKSVVFRGLIFRFPLDREFPGTLVAARRGNWLQEFFHDLFGAHNDTIATGDPDIDATHEIHTDNYSAARPVVEGPLVSALKYLRQQWWAGEARIALRGKDCFLLLPSERDYFALPDIRRDVDYTADVEPMIRDMVVLLAVAHLIRKLGATAETVPEEGRAGAA